MLTIGGERKSVTDRPPKGWSVDELRKEADRLGITIPSSAKTKAAIGRYLGVKSDETEKKEEIKASSSSPKGEKKNSPKKGEEKEGGNKTILIIITTTAYRIKYEDEAELLNGSLSVEKKKFKWTNNNVIHVPLESMSYWAPKYEKYLKELQDLGGTLIDYLKPHMTGASDVFLYREKDGGLFAKEEPKTVALDEYEKQAWITFENSIGGRRWESTFPLDIKGNVTVYQIMREKVFMVK
jgi:hypothetical protein